MDYPFFDYQERLGRKFAVCLSDSVDPGTNNACKTNLKSGYVFKETVHGLHRGCHITAGVSLKGEDGSCNPGSNFADEEIYDVTLADLRHAFDWGFYGCSIFDSDTINRYYIQKKYEWVSQLL
jgi:hypothetical protein